MARASNSSESRRRTVLVVDDSATMRRSVEMTLTLGGYDVVSAENGQAALARLQAGLRPDLLLTDLVMPVMDGLDLIRAARPLLRSTPMVMLTTQSQQHLRDEGAAAGATAWLLKPTGGQELLSLVQRFLKSPATAPMSAG